MNIHERCEFLRAMDLVARAAVTQEEYELVEDTSGGLIDRTADDDDLALFVEDDDDFADLLDEFLIVMRSLRENGGITCDSVNSGAPRIGSDRRWRGERASSLSAKEILELTADVRFDRGCISSRLRAFIHDILTEDVNEMFRIDPDRTYEIITAAYPAKAARAIYDDFCLDRDFRALMQQTRGDNDE